MKENRVRNIISRVLIVGGLATTAGALYDHSQNTVLNEENEARRQITKELRSTHNIEQQCTAGVFSQMPVCYDVVKGINNREDEKKLLGKYNTELTEQLSEVPYDQEANARGIRDGVVMVGGLLGFAAGMIVGSSKEREG